MKAMRYLARYGVSPLLLGTGIGLTVYLCLVIDRLQTAHVEDRGRLDGLAAGLLTQGRAAEAERKQLHGDIAKHHRWAEARWTDLDRRLGRIEAELGIDDAPAPAAGEAP